MTASERAAGEVADVDTLTGFIRNHPALPPRELAEALVAAGFGRVDAARREIAEAERRGAEAAWNKGWAAGRRDWWNETRTSNPYAYGRRAGTS